MADLILYDNPGSTNALKIRFLLAELGLEAERVEVPLRGPRPEGYEAVHPFGLVPALRVGDGLTITESNTALRFLAEREGRADLRGADPVERARVDMLLDSLSLELRPHVWGLEEVTIYGVAVSKAEREERIATLAGKLTSFDALLHPDGPHALGPALTIADAAIAGRLLHLPAMPLDPGVAPRTGRTLAAVMDRPAFVVARGG